MSTDTFPERSTCGYCRAEIGGGLAGMREHIRTAHNGTGRPSHGGDPMTALRTAAETFRHYEGLHRAKVPHGAQPGRADGLALAKAEANARLAEMCEAAIPTLYAMGLLTEEMGESLKLIGKGARFGLDSPGPAGEEYGGRTARQALSREVGDIGAAATYATKAGLVDGPARCDAENAKLRKLLDPEARDNLGRRLAPEVPQ